MTTLNEQLKGSIALFDEPKPEKAITPMDLMQLAINKEGSIDVIERLAKLQMDMQDRNDKVAFANAMALFKDQHLPRIVRTRSIRDKEGMEKYKAVALEDVANPLIKALLNVGVTYRFKSDAMTDGRIKITCYLRLQGTAYEEEGSTLAAPPDTSGGKDPLKAVGSTTSYLEKYTLLASCGVHVQGDDPEAVPHVSQDVGMDWVAKIEEGSIPQEVMAAWTNAMNVAKKISDYKAMTIFTEARDKKLLAIKSRGAR